MTSLNLPGPVAVLLAGAVGVYTLARLFPNRNTLLASFSALCLAMPLVQGLTSGDVMVALRLQDSLGASPTRLSGSAGSLLVSVALLLGVMVCIYGGIYMSRDRRIDRYYPLLLLMLAGTIGTILEQDLFTLYLYIALSTSASYVLVAFRRDTDTAIEAGSVRHYGSMGSLLMLSGIALLWRGTGRITIPMALDPADSWQLLARLPLPWAAGQMVVFPSHTWPGRSRQSPEQRSAPSLAS